MFRLLAAVALIFAVAVPAYGQEGPAERKQRLMQKAVAELNAGVDALQAGDNQKAVELITHAIELNVLDGNNLASAYFARGAAYARLHQCPSAIPDFTQAIAIKPDDPQFYGQRGNCYVETKQTNLAIADLKQAVALAPTDGSYVQFLCATAFNAKVYAEAAPACEASLQYAPKDLQLYQAAGQSYEAIGNKAKALAIWKQLLALDPTNEAAKQGIKRTSK